VSLLPRLGASPLEGYLSALTAGEAEPADLFAVVVSADGPLTATTALDELLPAPARQLLEAYGHAGKAGEVAEAPVSVAGRVIRVTFLGVGDQSAAALRRAGAELGRRCAGGKVAVADVSGLAGGTSSAGGTAGAAGTGGTSSAGGTAGAAGTGGTSSAGGTAGAAGTGGTSSAGGQADRDLQAFAEGVLLGGYRFRLTSEPDSSGPGEVRLLSADPDARAGAVRRAEIIAGAVAIARDLANTPSAGKSPQWLADEAIRITAGRGVAVRVWSEDDLAADGFGGILAVGSGSVRPPRLVELSYQPAGATTHVVLAGKGITFDSGGLSLKPNDGMKLMKTDMAGGGTVIAVMSALAELGVTARVTGLVAAAENMPSGSAYRPGDVITQYGGRSVEVLNTDAEGRLVLADALAYAVANLVPDQIIDIATLTGAARVALGGVYAALYATSDPLADSLTAAGAASGDRLWRMPLEDGYRAALDSPVADIAHVARSGPGAGSVVAALFLREFAGSSPWAHLDIAGAGRAAADDGELTKGATGFGTRLLLSWLSAAGQSA
jgi:leucyl aminopeptidase